MTFRYSATVLKVIDGDTIEVLLDMGFYLFLKRRFRVLNLDTYETKRIRTNTVEEVSIGKAAKEFAKRLLTGKTVEITSHKFDGDTDKYGRYLCDILLDDGIDYATLMKKKGFHNERTAQKLK